MTTTNFARNAVKRLTEMMRALNKAFYLSVMFIAVIVAIPVIGLTVIFKPVVLKTSKGGGMSRQKPTGYVAKCQCGVYIGALDIERTERSEAAKILGEWLASGCTVEPRFGSWNVELFACMCNKTGGGDEY